MAAAGVTCVLFDGKSPGRLGHVPVLLCWNFGSGTVISSVFGDKTHDHSMEFNCSFDLLPTRNRSIPGIPERHTDIK
jgi:hypothetical protein